MFRRTIDNRFYSPIFITCLSCLAIHVLAAPTAAQLRARARQGVQSVAEQPAPAVSRQSNNAKAQPSPAGASAESKAQSRQASKRGWALYESESYEQAKKQFDLAVSRDPGNADAFNRRAILLKRMKDLAGALRDNTRAVQLEPGDAVLRGNRAGILRDLERYDEAIDQAQAALKLDPLYGPAGKTLEWARIDKLRRDFIKPHNLTAADAQKYYWRGFEKRGIFMVQTCTTDERIGNLRVALALKGDVDYLVALVKELLRKAALLEKQGETQAALAQVTSAMAYEGDLGRSRSWPTQTAESCYQARCALLLRMNRRDDAFGDAKTLATKYSFRTNGSYDSFVKPWREAKQIERLIELETALIANRIGCLKRRAAYYDEIGRHQDALRDYAEHIAQKPQEHDSIAKPWLAAKDFRRLQDLESHIIAACQTSGRSSLRQQSLLRRASYYEMGGKPDNALADFAEYLKHNSWEGTGYRARADFYRRQKRLESAVEEYAVAIAKSQTENIGCAMAHLGRAQTWEALNEPYKAQADFEAALELYPQLEAAIRGKHRVGVALKDSGGDDLVVEFKKLVREIDQSIPKE